MLGIERDYYPIISPDINMSIEGNDLIWILGPQKMVGKLAKAQLL
jgi:CPA2 family monovalent cation:H+ antiporter-2